MAQKVYITSKNTATFICPECQRSTTVDVSKYANIDKKVKVNVKCACEAAFTVELEKRRKYRKATNLPGQYTYHPEGGPHYNGSMRIVDISSTGLKVELNVERSMNVGNMMDVEFHLDDKKRTLIKKKVIIRNVKKSSVGVSFREQDMDDSALGFYLLT